MSKDDKPSSEAENRETTPPPFKKQKMSDDELSGDEMGGNNMMVGDEKSSGSGGEGGKKEQGVKSEGVKSAEVKNETCKSNGLKSEGLKSGGDGRSTGAREQVSSTPRLNLTAASTSTSDMTDIQVTRSGADQAGGQQATQTATPIFNPAALSAQFALIVRTQKDKKAKKVKAERKSAEEKELFILNEQITNASQEAALALSKAKTAAKRREIRHWEMMRVNHAGQSLRGKEARGVWGESMRWLELGAQVGEVEDKYGWGLWR